MWIECALAVCKSQVRHGTTAFEELLVCCEGSVLALQYHDLLQSFGLAQFFRPWAQIVQCVLERMSSDSRGSEQDAAV